MKQPTVSVLIPTLNSAQTLPACLESIVTQNYPRERVEIIVADGGSSDGTPELALSYGAEVIENPLKTGEAGKAAALRRAAGDLVALVDSDNILPQRDWLVRMIAPMAENRDLVGSEPWEFTRRDCDPAFTRYCAMLGMNDPLCHFIGNYDRLNMLTGKWTSLPVNAVDGDDFLTVELEAGLMPTIGANGTVWRRDALGQWRDRDYFFDVDVTDGLARSGSFRFAKVKIGIVHLYADGLHQFAAKQTRRIRDYLYFRRYGRRSDQWSAGHKRGLVRFMSACLTVAPLLKDSWTGYRRSSDSAWLLHAPACWLTLVIYAWGAVVGQLRRSPESRERWNA